MTKNQAIEIARNHAKSQGWRFADPVTAYCMRRYYIFGAWRWFVRSNAGNKGGNHSMHIDDATGAISDVMFVQ